MVLRSSGADASSAPPRWRGNTTSGRKGSHALRARSGAARPVSAAADAAIVVSTESGERTPRERGPRRRRARQSPRQPEQPQPVLEDGEHVALALVDEEVAAG